jgi:effector-binding domain-containing protein
VTNYEVRTVEVTPTPMAALREDVLWADLADAIRKLLDRVYAFLSSSAVTQHGHNVCVYRSASEQGANMEVGVQVAAPFVAIGEIVCSTTPAGKAAWTIHMGGYERLTEAHQAINIWCQTHAVAAGRCGGRFTATGSQILTHCARMFTAC